MKKPIIIIGIGEMAGVFARGFLRTGYPVYPITRDMDISTAANAAPEPELVLVAVAEKDLQATLANIPTGWHDKLALLQNELLPRDWESHPFENITVISVWFEKKKGQDAKVLISSPTFGPKAALLKDALNSIDIACHVVDSEEKMLFELVRKNVYILTTNIAGLETGGNVAELWQNHETLARDVVSDVVKIQTWLTGKEQPEQALIEGMLEAFEGDPEHKCMGRSAPARLTRALALASEASIETPTLQRISNGQR